MDSTELTHLNERPLSDIGEQAIESYTSLGAIGVGDLVVYMMEILGELRSTAHLSENGWYNFEQIDGSLRELVLGEKYEDRQKTVKFDLPTHMFPGAMSGILASGVINPVPSILTAPIVPGTPAYAAPQDDDDIEFDDRFDDDNATDEMSDNDLGYDHSAPVITDKDIQRIKDELNKYPGEIHESS